MNELPFEVVKELEGWTLFWAHLRVRGGHDRELMRVRQEVATAARERWELASLSGDPVVAGLRKLFRAAGCDPTRYRPSSEALVRRILKGGEIPEIHPLVDLNNCLSLALAVPCCVMAAGTFSPPLLFRTGQSGESYESLKGPFRLDGKPLLCDTVGPLDAPITGSVRVKVAPDTKEAWMVAYLPEAELEPEKAERTLFALVGEAPAVSVDGTAFS